MKKLLLALSCSLLFVASCGQQSNHNEGVDGYKFERETFTREQLMVSVVLVTSQTEMTALLAKHGRTAAAGNDVMAFSTYKPNEPDCTIYMIDPKLKYQPEFIGHEFVHCVYGDWHPSQP